MGSSYAEQAEAQAELTTRRLQALQERHKPTRQEFADWVGVSKMTVGRWLKGERTPDSGWLDKILVAFGETRERFEDLDP